MFPVGVIGTGVVGTSVALTLFRKGYQIRGVCSKNGASALKLASEVKGTKKNYPEDVLEGSKIIFLTTPDSALSGLAEKLAASGKVNKDHIFIHMSGALPLSILNPLKEKGAMVCSLHPLQAFASVKKAMENLSGTWFALQYDSKVGDIAYQLVTDLGGQAFPISDSQKSLYHLGASMASNYLVSLIHLTTALYEKIGLTQEEAVKALIPLLRGTLDNIETLGPVKALTGPIARGDKVTVKRHMQALGEADTLINRIYRTFGEYTVQVAIEKESIDEEQAVQLKNIFQEGYENGSRK